MQDGGQVKNDLGCIWTKSIYSTVDLFVHSQQKRKYVFISLGHMLNTNESHTKSCYDIW